MGKERQRETILKTDQRNLYPELGLQGNYPSNQVVGARTGSCSKAMFLKCQ
jgi:hypothetical protein